MYLVFKDISSLLSYQLSQSWLHNQSMNVNCDFKGMIKGIGPEIWIFVM